MLADDLCFGEGTGVLAQMTKLFRQFRCSIVAIEEVPADETNRYGIIAGEALSDSLFRVTDMVEKPSPDKAPSNLAIIGRYILTPDIFEILDQTEPGKNGEIQITDALLKQAQGRLRHRLQVQRPPLRLRNRRRVRCRDELLLSSDSSVARAAREVVPIARRS